MEMICNIKEEYVNTYIGKSGQIIMIYTYTS
jgi:hypothetical protein